MSFRIQAKPKNHKTNHPQRERKIKIKSIKLNLQSNKTKETKVKMGYIKSNNLAL